MSNRILLVDDEPRNLALLGGYLRPLGYDLIEAHDGLAALAAFEEHHPDLVVLDCVMPGLDGLEVLTRIRTGQRGNHVPVILVTTHAHRDHHLGGIQAGADDFIEKPVDAAKLIARVRILLELKQSRDALQSSRDELQQRHDALKEAQREHRELTEFIVHDLKSPLSVVCAGLEWARAQVLPSQAGLTEAIADSRRAAERLSAMVGDLLMISRMEQVDFPLRRESVSLPKLFDAIVQSYARRADEQGIAFAPPSDFSLDVQADRTLLQRVLENILDNAFRYTPRHGRIAITARAWRGVEIVVSNDGPPIPLLERQRIFEKFRRGGQEEVGVGVGAGAGARAGNAGLGLYFCKRAIEAHGGAIDVVETPDWPTSFLINLP